jgi:hypothetical protein
VSTPELKQEWDLSLVDFERHHVWIGVHNLDLGKPWYEVSNEATYRPWTEVLPVAAEKGSVLVAATFELRDGTTYAGFIGAAPENWDVPPPPRTVPDGGKIQQRSFSARCGGSSLAVLGIQQPRVFVNHQVFRFWGGRRGIPVEKRQAFHTVTGKAPDAIFPLRFRADPKFATGILTGQVDGFYRLVDEQPPQVEL